MWFKKKSKEPGKNHNKRWTSEEIKTLLSGLNNNASFKDIAKTLGREESAVLNKYLSIDRKRRSGGWSPEETLRLIYLWNNNYSTDQIAYDLDRKRTSVDGKLAWLPSDRSDKKISIPEKIKDIKFKYDYPFGEHLVSFEDKKIHSKPSKSQDTQDINQRIKDLALKGYEIDHISELVNLSGENVIQSMEEMNIYDEYESLILKRSEDRVFSQPIKGIEKSDYANLLVSREEEEKKAVTYIKKLISSPEGTTIEFKESFWRSKISRERCPDTIHSTIKNINAFLNTLGGDIIIGVVDGTKEVVGIEFDFYKNDETYYRKIYDHIHNSMEDIKHLVRLGIVELNEKKVFHINVQPSDKPVYLVNKDYNKFMKYAHDHDLFYSREGDSAILKRGKELFNYIKRQFPDYSP